MNSEYISASDDDITSMKARLPLSGLQYLDVAARQDLQLALARWPLLNELAQPPIGTT